MEKTMKNRKPRKREHAFFPITMWILTFLWCFILIVVLFWGIIQSLKTDFNFWFDSVGFPAAEYGGWSFENYTKVFTQVKIPDTKGNLVYFPEMIFNSLYYCLVNGFFSVLAPMICSYVYAKYSRRVPWTRILWIILLINLYVPLSASLAASLEFSMIFGFYDNLYLYSITSLTGFNSAFLIYYATWKGVSWEYAEAGYMDGASDFRIFFEIMFPMTVTVFGVLYVSDIIAFWANYTTPMIYLPSYPTVAYGVYYFTTFPGEEDAGNIPVQLAALFASATPMLALFIAFKDKMMGSLTMGGLKG